MEQRNEIQQLLQLTQAEIEYSLRDSDESVAQLTDSFSGMNARINAVNQLLNVIREKQPLDDDSMAQLKSDHTVIEVTIQQAIMAFQFYDRLTQRLQHINKNLSEIIALIADADQQQSGENWQQLLQVIRSGYNMEDNRLLFDEIMSGVPMQDAIDKIRSQLKNESADDDIELF